MRTEAIWDSGGQFAGTRIRVDYVGEIDGDQVEPILRAWTVPADPDQLSMELAALKVSTVPRQMAEQDEDLQLEIYIRAMLQYPADCALEALRRPRKWFPALVELTEDASRLAEKRNALVAKLRGAYT